VATDDDDDPLVLPPPQQGGRNHPKRPGNAGLAKQGKDLMDDDDADTVDVFAKKPLDYQQQQQQVDHNQVQQIPPPNNNNNNNNNENDDALFGSGDNTAPEIMRARNDHSQEAQHLLHVVTDDENKGIQDSKADDDDGNNNKKEGVNVAKQ
jgi:hypothetical protein